MNSHSRAQPATGVIGEDGVLYVDNSTLETMGVCERKCQLRYVKGLAPAKEPDALEFGRAFHAALATYYKAIDRVDHTVSEDLAIESAILAFVDEGRNEHSTLAITRDDTPTARSLERGIDVLRHYFAKHPRNHEHWKIIAVETGFSCALTSSPPIIYRGRIDLIVEMADAHWVIDHKTTTSLGPRYFERLRPNDQITSYLWAASQHLGKPVTKAMLNAICIYKEDKPGRDPFARGTTMRSEADVAEWHARAVDRAMDVYERLQPGRKHGKFHKSTGYCHTWGGCPFIPICKIPDDPRFDGSRETILASEYEVRPWIPY